MKNIKVRFAGIVVDSKDKNFSVIYIPDQDQRLRAGQKYQITVEGLSFEHKETGEK